MTSGQELVVVGVDGSAESVAALAWAARYASGSGARVRALLAWHYPGAVGGPPTGVTPEPVREQTAGVERTVGYGHPAEVLINASKEADLLVVGSRGHRAWTGMLVG